jgi:hypothetical protein
MPGLFLTGEILGSPVIRLQRRESTATRWFILDSTIAIDEFIREIFPPFSDGYPYTARFPGYPFLYAESLQIEPFFGDEVPPIDFVPTFPPNYQYIKATVNYRSPKWDSNLQSHTPDHAKDGPGGCEGSTKGTGSPNTPNAVFITHEVDVGGEFFTYQNNALRWEYAINDSILPVDPADPKVQVQSTQRAGRIVGKAEHTITWNYCPFPPWNDIFQAIGTVNTFPFGGAAGGCLLFLGCRGTREYSPGSDAIPTWKLVYKFSYKNYNAKASQNDPNPEKSYADAHSKPATIAQGWNYFLRPGATSTNLPGGKTFQRILTKDKKPIYDNYDFTLLFTTSDLPPC